MCGVYFQKRFTNTRGANEKPRRVQKPQCTARVRETRFPRPSARGGRHDEACRKLAVDAERVASAGSPRDDAVPGACARGPHAPSKSSGPLAAVRAGSGSTAAALFPVDGPGGPAVTGAGAGSRRGPTATASPASRGSAPPASVVRLVVGRGALSPRPTYLRKRSSAADENVVFAAAGVLHASSSSSSPAVRSYK